ncbi:pyruvate ferredoxin oxidoreductase [Candidatus Woesearchaeota archaeon]|jgi:pyruvate ferredoxin oxidoreductase alpha subunit|nr:pyruvate ferredoxin oxidoreductase [Candidatus Woesearchaeota archaeon]MBT3538056.1 pyruvate ferredoxin oxidoreductase [Candidatus Woesearchaeota archaeon]MBT4697140.1 pyruvate ferredoxin oxidoreductase [Candidatus Woesearchaeota archaeon]MBT4717131.1 pyruvate ferredoxin oxidoreductase [Candidatus Woesearchaeota archaeon]MBT7105725.1 pyruvate ferredoxin oxidoreductase [Candidatus Woesearchaeota archaeon]
MIKKTMLAMTGADAVAEAMRQINPDVVAAYPITPQTPIMHGFCKYYAQGKVDTELITVESEHSAMSAVVGAAAAGARAMTATAANGLALMFEIVYIAASCRLPIVMNVANRALSAPINIHCDHSDSMACRDTGWLQLYSETSQEAYENTLMAVRIAEHPDVHLPVMVCQDGFITSHSMQNTEIFDDNDVKKFIGEYSPKYSLLDTDNPVTVGPFDMYNYYFEHKRQQLDAMEKSFDVITDVFSEFGKLVGKEYDFFEGYQLEDAEEVIVALNSSCGTTKDVIDELRAKGKKVGLLKVRVFRPFNFKLIVEKLKHAKTIAVLDRSASFGGFGGPVFTEIRSSFHESDAKPNIINYIYGLGGRELDLELVHKVFNEIKEISETGELGIQVRCLGVRQ